jgi:glycine C-acetyltransferase/8-amino-7-oxononanoate synthase
MPRRFEDELENLRRQSLLRQLREAEPCGGMMMNCGGRELVNFASNDYLGLSGEVFLREAAKRAIDEHGIGSGASRLVCGTRAPHRLLEEKLAEFKNTEAALSFSTGYAAAVGILSALAGKEDVLILDKLVHASLVDGARLSGAVLRVFPHNNTQKLESHLQWARQEYPDARVIVVTESVFSMDGDRAPLAEIVALKDRYGALLLIDEAHAVGVIGTHGRGLADRLGLADRVDLQMGTLSKALGVSGGYLCGSRALVDLLINRARAFIFSTAPPPAVAAAAAAAVDFLQTAEGEARRERLRGNLRVLAAGLPPGLTPERLQSAIVPVILGQEETALDGARRLQEHGLFVPAIRYPTVARGAARLRITLSTLHTEEQIARLNESLESLARLIPGEPRTPRQPS